MDPELVPTMLRALPAEVKAGVLLARAAPVPATFDEKALEVDVVMGSGTAVVRVPWFDEPYIEELSMDPAHVRLERLNSGRAALLNTHNRWDLDDQIGVIVSARVEGGKLVGRVRFSRREDVAPIVQDVRDGIYSNLSIGYRVNRFQEVTLPTDSMRRLRAVDWEPFECSLVPVPADPTSEVRSFLPVNDKVSEGALVGRALDTWTTCKIEGREAGHKMTPEEIKAAQEAAARAAAAATNPTTPTPAATAVLAPPADATRAEEIARARTAERERCAEATRLATAHKLGDEWATRMINDPVMDIAAIQRAALTALHQRSTATAGTSHVTVGDGPVEKTGAAIERALEVRMGVEKEHTKESVQLRRYPVSRLAEMTLQARGVRTGEMSVNELFQAAVKRDVPHRFIDQQRDSSGLMTTSDFTELLSNVQGKAMRKAYENTPQTWLAFARRSENPDFKPVKRIQISGGTGLSRVNEHGEVKRGSYADSAETYNLETEGLIVGFTRKTFVNDDLGELARTTARMGSRAADRRSDLVYALITGNAVMADGNAWFSTAHLNLHASGAGSVLQESSLTTALVSMMTKKDSDGNFISLRPATLLVPVALWVAAMKLTSIVTPNQTSTVNVFSGMFDRVLKDPRLDANSATAWYMFASTDNVDVIEYAELMGQAGPQVMVKNGFDVDGVEYRILDDFGCAPLESVSAFKSPGA